MRPQSDVLAYGADSASAQTIQDSGRGTALNPLTSNSNPLRESRDCNAVITIWRCDPPDARHHTQIFLDRAGTGEGRQGVATGEPGQLTANTAP